MPSVDDKYLLTILSDLLNIPSPTGYTDDSIAFVQKSLAHFPGMEFDVNRKGSLLVSWGKSKSHPIRAVTAHIDTLGAMVKEIKENGRLRLSAIGGLQWNSVESEGCTVFTRQGKKVRGSLLLEKSSSHVYGRENIETQRGDDSMEVRLDEFTSCPEDTRGLGINIGDFVAFDPRVEVNNNFVRSRHLDDKAGAACMLAAIKAIYSSGKTPPCKTYLYFSNHEEVGHGGASGIPSDADELLVIDMAAVGTGQNSDEFHTSICLKDTGGPYDHAFSSKLRSLADDHKIPYRSDIYIHYSSDGTAYWRSGGQGVVALIGPGVDASHNYERTHLNALLDTTRWITAYILSE
jgi:putative aminopeptidase FrvX